MKIRNGFVSNSSSSSFIVKLDKKPSEYNLTSFMSDYDIPEVEKEYADILLKDLNRAENNYTEVSDYIYIDLEDSSLSFEDRNEIVSKATEYTKKLISDKIDQLKSENQFSIEYFDDSTEAEAYMENSFMPRFKATIQVISHH